MPQAAMCTKVRFDMRSMLPVSRQSGHFGLFPAVKNHLASARQYRTVAVTHLL